MAAPRPDRLTPARLVAAAVAALALLGSGCTSDEVKVEQYRTEALQEREAGNHDTARILLRQALALAPQDAEINLELARTLRDLDRLGDAAFYFGEAYRLDPGLTEAALAQAPLLYASDPEQARSLVDEVLEREPSNALAHVRNAELLLMDELPEEALAEALTARELDPDDVLTHRMVATAYEAIIAERIRTDGREGLDESLYEKGLEALGRARELAERPWIDVHGEARLYASWPGHREEARRAFEEAFALAREHGSEQGMRRIAAATVREAVESGDREFVRQALRRRLEVDPDQVNAWQQLAETLDAREPGSGEAVWKEAVEERPEDPLVHVGYASYLGGRDRSDDALAHLESLPAEVAGSPEIDLLRVKLYVERDRLDEARDVVARMRQRQDASPLAGFAAARVAAAEGDLERASVQLRAVADELQRSDAHRLLAEIEAARGDLRNALAAANRAIESAASPGPALFRLRHRILVSSGDWEGLMQSLGEMRRRGPGWGPPDRLQLVHATYQLGRPNRARALLERLLEADEPPPAVVRTFVRYEGRRQPERARDLLEAALERRPGNARLAASLAELELATGSPEAALEGLASAGAPDDLPPGLRVLRARILGRLGRWEEAETDARAAFEAQPRPQSAARVLARTLRARDRVEAAISTLEQARADRGLAGTDLWLLGRLYLEDGELEKSRVILEEAVGAAPQLPEARNDLAYVLAETGGDLDRALDLARQAKSALPDNAAVADTLGQVYRRRGLLEPAVSEFRSAIELAADDGDEGLRADLHVHLARTLHELGRSQEALAALDSALEIQPEHEEALELRQEVASTETAATGG